MRYMGGKHRQSKAIAKAIHSKHVGEPYCEPFCGALGSAEKVAPHMGSVSLSDASLPLVMFWNAVLDGWEPPDLVSEETYAKYAERRHDPDVYDPMSAYCGYAMSFGGKWYGGLARSNHTDRSQRAQKKACLRKAAALRSHVKAINNLDYREALRGIPDNVVVYLDPPYFSRTVAHHTARGFDTSEFWRIAEALARTNYVYVSEFVAPEGWIPVHVWGDTVVRHGVKTNEGNASEALFILKHEGRI
jgi:DNA adenine methylase